MDLEKIKEYWEDSGKKFPESEKITPTSRDPFLGELERENILKYLESKFTCLEIGCGDAFHTIHYAKKVKKLTGIDLAESLIKIAKKRFEQENVVNAELLSSSVLDIDNKLEDRKFDAAISQRCLINLPNWEYQKNAILQIHKHLSNDGIFILTEGFQENLENLNKTRKMFSLSEIKVVDYNRNFLLSEFMDFIPDYFEILEKHFYGTYLFFSRVYHPLAVFPDNPRHDSKLNEVALAMQKSIRMPDLEKYSYNIAFVLRKKNN